MGCLDVWDVWDVSVRERCTPFLLLFLSLVFGPCPFLSISCRFHVLSFSFSILFLFISFPSPFPFPFLSLSFSFPFSCSFPFSFPFPFSCSFSFPFVCLFHVLPFPFPSSGFFLFSSSFAFLFPSLSFPYCPYLFLPSCANNELAIQHLFSFQKRDQAGANSGSKIKIQPFLPLTPFTYAPLC